MVCLAVRKERKGKGIMGEVEEREENDILESYFDSSKQKKKPFYSCLRPEICENILQKPFLCSVKSALSHSATEPHHKVNLLTN